MRRNVSGQYIGIQLVSKTDGSAVTSGATTVYVTGDAGTQAAGSVGSGACTHEGNGFWTYAPAQAETNYTHVAFTFVNSSAVNATVQVFPTAYDASGRVDVGAVGGTAQTARDLGASVLLSSGTGTGQISLSSGLVTLAAVTHTGATIPTVTTTTTATNLTNERGKYAMGSVWIGPTANTNTVSYTDGITTNPVSTIAAAKTIADALGFRRFEVIRTGAITIGAALAGYRVSGVGWSGNTTGGAQDVGTSAFIGGNITAGTFASTTGTINWERCEFSDGVTIGVSNVTESRFNGGLTLSTAGNYDFVDCASSVAGTGTPTFTLPAGTVNVSFRRWSGGITISGITSGSTVSIDMVSGGTITLNGADGNVQARGMCSGITDNRTGSPTLGQNAALNRTTLATPTNITAGTITTVSGNVTGSVGSVTGLTAADVGAIKTKTDSLTFTQTGMVDANIQRINDVLITGDGQTGTEFGV